MVPLRLTVRPRIPSPYLPFPLSVHPELTCGADRWKEALLASRNHPQGEKIVPRVNLRGTSMTALGEGKGKVTLDELKRFSEE
jgi:hypothetical protein